MKNFLPKLMARITRHPREIVDVKWSPDSWTHNVFRFYEMLFGRRYGVKHEMSAWTDGITTVYQCHSIESIFALTEQYIRGLIPRWQPLKIWIPKRAPIEGYVGSPFLFAVAFDTSGLDAEVNTVATLSYTVTGSNPYLYTNLGYEPTRTLLSNTYNLASLTSVVGQVLFQGGGSAFDLQYLVAPATGTHNIIATWTGSGGKSISASSFTGVNQIAPPANSTNTQVNGASPLTQSITTTIANSWIVWGFGVSGTASASTNTTIRQQEALFNGFGIADTNASQGSPGSKSMSITYSTNLWQAGIQAEVPPVPPTNILSVSNVAQASISSVSTVANASISSVSGVANQ